MTCRKKKNEEQNVHPIYRAEKPKKMKTKAYEKELARLEVELVKLQGWIQAKGLKIVVIFEGRDSAGKGGVIKYWLDISDATQEERFKQRMDDPRRRWKLSPMDLQARARWVDYSKARDAMLIHTNTDHAPCYIVDANVKKHARLNVITYLLSLIPYEDLTPESLELPPRQEAGDYQRPDISQFNIVPAIYP